MRILTRVAVTAISLALGACTQDNGRSSDAAVTTNSARVESTAPAAPSNISEPTPEGAAAFESFYVKLLDHGARTGQIDELERSSDPACDGCRYYIDLFERIRRDGGSVGKRSWSTSPSKVRLDTSKVMQGTVRTNLRVTAGSVQLSANEKPRDYARLSRPVEFVILHDGTWRVSEFRNGGRS